MVLLTDRADSEMSTVDLSVIVPAYNEEAYIRDCVESIAAQSASCSYEILVCDDASTDGTPRILAELAEEIPDLRVFENDRNRGRIGTLQRLVAETRSDRLLRIDGDSVLQSGTLAAVDDAFEAGGDLVFGKVDVANTEYLHPAAAQVGKERGRSTWYGGGCVAVRKGPFLDVGGFQEEMSDAEALELEQRAKKMDWEVVYLDDYGIESNFPVALAPVLKRKFRSLRTHLTQYDGAPENVDLTEFRGPVFWSVTVAAFALALVFPPSLLVGLALLAVPISVYGRDALLGVELSGRRN